MDLLYFNGNNFGDKLNPFLFFALFDRLSFIEAYPDHIILGLGSILSNAYFGVLPEGYKAIPFGSGVRQPDITPPQGFAPGFVRGPVSSKYMGCDYIADTAYLFPLLKDYKKYTAAEKKYDLSVMPYFKHTNSIDWAHFERLTGVHVIDPTGPLLTVLDEIAASGHIVAGAMHGCIVADVFRIPWARLRFTTHETEPLVQDVKWLDWTLSINVADYPLFRMKTDNTFDQASRDLLEKELTALFSGQIDSANFALSSEDTFNAIVSKLHGAVKDFSRQYSVSINKYRTNLPG